MNKIIAQTTSTFAIALTLMSQVSPPAFATSVSSRSLYNDGVYRTNSQTAVDSHAQPVQYRFYTRTPRAGVFQRHPILSRTLVGTGIGAAGGAIVGAISGRHRAGRGALIGGGTGALVGAGMGLYRNRQYTGRWF